MENKLKDWLIAVLTGIVTKPDEIEIEDDELEIKDDTNQKDNQKDNLNANQEKGDDKEKEETFDIDEKDLVKIIHSTLQEQLDKSAEKISEGLKEDINDNFKRLTGKVM